MSRPEIYNVKCTKCGHLFDFEAWSSVNSTLDPELKDQLLNRSIFTGTCPNCGEEIPIVYPCLYHDMEKQLMIQLCSGEDIKKYIDNMEKSQEIMAKQFKSLKESNYKYRFVTDLNCLNEKIFIFDANLDDKVLELMKLTIKGRLETEKPIQQLFYSREDDKNHFVIMTEDGIIGSWEIPEDMYDYFIDLYEKNNNLDNEQYCVDEKWAIGFINSMGEQHG